MRSRFFFLAGVLALVTPLAAFGAEARPFPLIEADQRGDLTIAEAKKLVAQTLLQSGQNMLRAGHAEFAGNGNVLVQNETFQGIPLRQVLVDGHTRQVAAVKSPSRG